MLSDHRRNNALYVEAHVSVQERLNAALCEVILSRQQVVAN